jgi:hypothetical protein
MHPWAIEEVVLRPVATLVVGAALPFVTAWLLRKLLQSDGRALQAAGLLVGTAEIAVGVVGGLTALGPAVVERRDGPASLAFAALGALVAAFAGAVARRAPTASALHALRARVRGCAWAAGPVVVGALPALLWSESPGWLRSGSLAVGVVVGLLTGARPWRTWPWARAGVITGSLLAALIAAALVALASATRIEVDTVREAGGSAATWRLRVDPWDGVAMLAAGWAARSRDAPSRAEGWVRSARAHGAPEPETLELEAELQAAEGDCETARATFDRALRARAAAAFHDPLAAPLPLGGFRLPPTLVTACGGLGGATAEPGEALSDP